MEKFCALFPLGDCTNSTRHFRLSRVPALKIYVEELETGIEGLLGVTLKSGKSSRLYLSRSVFHHAYLDTDGVPRPLCNDLQTFSELCRQDGGAFGECLVAEEPQRKAIENQREVSVGGWPRCRKILLSNENVQWVNIALLELLNDGTMDGPCVPLAGNPGVPEFAAGIFRYAFRVS